MPTSPTYASDLSDDEWNLIEGLMPKPKKLGRRLKHTVRTLLNAMFYLNRTGAQWAMLPREFPPKSTVFDHYQAWSKCGLWEHINARLREKVRKAEGRMAAPTAAILDSQSVKTAEAGGEEIGYDAGKKVRGRKRHLLVDSLGMILGLRVSSAAVQDRDGARMLLAAVYCLYGRLAIIWADSGYAGKLVAWVKNLRPYGRLHLDIVRRNPEAKGFELVRKRWVVERTFSWLYKCRRLTRDYERLLPHSESQVYIAMTRLMLKRLASRS